MECEKYCQAWWGTLWPWAEANQGLLSVMALVVAIGLVLYEQSRTRETERKRTKDFATLGSDLIEHILEESRTARKAFAAGVIAGDTVTDWRDARFAVEKGLAAMIPTSPSAQAAVIIADVTRIIDEQKDPFNSAAVVANLDDKIWRLEKKQADLAALTV
jgi:hypothetical protein